MVVSGLIDGLLGQSGEYFFDVGGVCVGNDLAFVREFSAPLRGGPDVFAARCPRAGAIGIALG